MLRSESEDRKKGAQNLEADSSEGGKEGHAPASHRRGRVCHSGTLAGLCRRGGRFTALGGGGLGGRKGGAGGRGGREGAERWGREERPVDPWLRQWRRREAPGRSVMRYRPSWSVQWEMLVTAALQVLSCRGRCREIALASSVPRFVREWRCCGRIWALWMVLTRLVSRRLLRDTTLGVFARSVCGCRGETDPAN